jgi:hypothetical protein
MAATVIVRRWFLNVILVILGLALSGLLAAGVVVGVRMAAGGRAFSGGGEGVLLAAWSARYRRRSR